MPLPKLKPLIPLSFESVRLAFRIPGSAYGSVSQLLRTHQQKEGWLENGDWACVIEIPAGMKGDVIGQVFSSVQTTLKSRNYPRDKRVSFIHGMSSGRFGEKSMSEGQVGAEQRLVTPGMVIDHHPGSEQGLVRLPKTMNSLPPDWDGSTNRTMSFLFYQLTAPICHIQATSSSGLLPRFETTFGSSMRTGNFSSTSSDVIGTMEGGIRFNAPTSRYWRCCSCTYPRSR